MPDIEEQIARFDRLLADLDGITEINIETTANDGLAILDHRVTDTGQGVNGPLKDYTKPYEEKKKKSGRFRGFVDLSFSGQMWASIGIVEKKTEDGKYVVTIGGRDEFTVKKMEGNNKARPGVFGLNNEEVAILREDSGDRLAKAVKSYLVP